MSLRAGQPPHPGAEDLPRYTGMGLPGTSSLPGLGIASQDSSEKPAVLPVYPNPNTIPYRTRKSAFRKVLSLPAYVWRAIWYPVGEGVIWMEQNHVHQKVINFFMNDARTGGVFPIASIGGSAGFAAGFMAFHSNLFDRRKQGNLQFLFGSTDNFRVDVNYSDPQLKNNSLNLTVLGSYIVDEDENYFLSNNTSGDPEEDKSSYATTQAALELQVGYRPKKRLNVQIVAGLKETDISAGGREGGDRFPLNLPGSGRAALAKFGGMITWDYRNGWPRTLSGALLRLGYDFTSEIHSVDYQFHRYSVELQHFFSPPFLATNRRFSVRGRLEKVEEITGNSIPFYELSMIGDPRTLRGYDQNRFRDKGSLLFNLEYRYPIWDTWDAVIFLDEGQVFSRYEQIALNRFKHSAGFGIRLMTQTGFILRLEMGIGQEESRLLLEMMPLF